MCKTLYYYFPVCNLEREEEGNGRGKGDTRMGVRGGWGELVWWGKEGTDVGEGVSRLIRTFAQIFGF